MLVQNFLEESATRRPDKTALIAGAERYSYAEVNAMADRISHALVTGGLQKGDRAVIFLDNSLAAVAALFGVLKAGGVFVMLNPSVKAEKLSYVLNNCRASVLIGPASGYGIISEAASSSPHLRNIFLSGKMDAALPGKAAASLDEIISSAATPGTPCRSIDADLATIIYTSGSTGSPKGVMMAHYNMTAAADSITTYLENTEEDIILNTLPISFDYGLYQVLMAFKMGATVILEKSFLYPYKTIETMLKENVTGFPIVPTMSAILMQMEDIGKKSFSRLRYITNTAAALPISHIQKLREFFPTAALYSMYGLTECKRVSYLPPDQLDKRPGSVGRGMPNTEVYIVGEDEKRVAPGVVGELVVRGRNVMRGYWEMPGETAKKLRPGTYPGELILYTGDLFKSDDEGYLYFVGRRDEIIKSRGEKVSPREIENVLCSMQGVAEAAVVGVPDPVLGEAVKAVIVKRPGVQITEKDVRSFCSKRLEDHMVPKVVEFAAGLPKSENGKIKKTCLTESFRSL
ncbi:MAG: AMP-binding protein [Deltaproteobacteria bacterium]|nr:AMP-binding protein [Deltaproteobacteria bacterium]